VTIAVETVIAVCVWGFYKAKNYYIKRKQEKKFASTIRQEFLNNVEQYRREKEKGETANEPKE